MPCPPGMCGHAPDCNDLRCPGHPLLFQKDGGHTFDGGVVFPIEDGPQEEPREGRPMPSAEQVESWPARVLVALLLLLVIAAAVSPLAFI